MSSPFVSLPIANVPLCFYLSLSPSINFGRRPETNFKKESIKCIAKRVLQGCYNIYVIYMKNEI